MSVDSPGLSVTVHTPPPGPTHPGAHPLRAHSPGASSGPFWPPVKGDPATPAGVPTSVSPSGSSGPCELAGGHRAS